jgi:hypothetical protein
MADIVTVRITKEANNLRKFKWDMPPRVGCKKGITESRGNIFNFMY